MKQIIYRIEEKENKRGPVYEGPYFNSLGGSIQWQEKYHNSPQNPTCDEDKALVKNYQQLQQQHNYQFDKFNFYCGFTSLNQITRWFTPQELINLNNQGFIIAIYEAEVLISSKKQALFIPKKGIPRKVLAITF